MYFKYYLGMLLVVFMEVKLMTELLGKRIREERQNLNLTQEQLSEKVDLTTAYIGQIERGERNLTLENLIKVANCLGVTVDYLLSDSLTAEKDTTLMQLSQLLNGKTLAEKEMAVDIIKTLFRHLEHSSGGTEVK